MNSPIDFDNISYLENGNSSQRRAFEVLTSMNFPNVLGEFDPILVGTIPIGIDIESSDLDILCYAQDLNKFEEILKERFSGYPRFSVKWDKAAFSGTKSDSDRIESSEVLVANFAIDGTEIEIFGQNVPTRLQQAYRHMIVEHRILVKKGDDFRNRIIELKKAGYKTEPAFAMELRLKGDPYQSLLELETGQESTKRYRDYPTYIKEHFGERVQKLSIDSGFTCPNRDGSKGTGGCTYCNANSFKPDYCKPEKSVTHQIEEGISFFSSKYKTQKYLAYFQSYSNTYGDREYIKELYQEALDHPAVIGLVIGTRPDCIDEEMVDYLSGLARKHYISLELGIESTLERTLVRVNRCHSYEETKAAYALAENRGIHLGAHMIIGLPGESRDEVLGHADELSTLPVNSLKLHQLQIVKHTQMAYEYKRDPGAFDLFTPDHYVDLVAEFVSRLRPDIIIERFISQSPPQLLIVPQWDLKNFEIVARIENRLRERNLWQGKNCLKEKV